MHVFNKFLVLTLAADVAFSQVHQRFSPQSMNQLPFAHMHVHIIPCMFDRPIIVNASFGVGGSAILLRILPLALLHILTVLCSLLVVRGQQSPDSSWSNWAKVISKNTQKYFI